MNTTETILLVVNVIFAIIAVYLFLRLQKLTKKYDPDSKQQSSDNIDPQELTRDEFEPERFGIKAQDIAPINSIASDIPQPKIVAQEMTGLKLEDELPEIKEKQKGLKKKTSGKKLNEGTQNRGPEKAELKITAPEKSGKGKKKKPAKRETERGTIEVKPSEKIPVSVKTELKIEDTAPEEEMSGNKESKKKKPAKNAKEEAKEAVDKTGKKKPKKK